MIKTIIGKSERSELASKTQEGELVLLSGHSQDQIAFITALLAIGFCWDQRRLLNAEVNPHSFSRSIVCD